MLDLLVLMHTPLDEIRPEDVADTVDELFDHGGPDEQAAVDVARFGSSI